MHRLALVAAFCVPTARRGDIPWWLAQIGGFTFGIGEISNRILIYWGESSWVTPLPSGSKWLILYAFAAVSLVVSASVVSMWRRRLRRLDSHKPPHNDGAVQPAPAASGAEPPPPSG